MRRKVSLISIVSMVLTVAADAGAYGAAPSSNVLDEFDIPTDGDSLIVPVDVCGTTRGG